MCLFKSTRFDETRSFLFSHTLQELSPRQTGEQWTLEDHKSPKFFSAGYPWTYSALSLTPELCVFCCQEFGACLQVLCLLSLVTWWLFCTSFCSFTISPGSLFLLTKPLLLGRCSLLWAHKNMEQPPRDACHPPPTLEWHPFKTRISKIIDNNKIFLHHLMAVPCTCHILGWGSGRWTQAWKEMPFIIPLIATRLTTVRVTWWRWH